jgi:branched-chain amino acid transport system ATP-binding protein
VTAPILQLTDISKSFGALKVTDGVSLDLRPGEIHALIGPNGAGKTTLIHQICGTVTPDSGKILFENNDITAMPPHLRARAGLARTFQITSIIPSLTTLENVALAAQAVAPKSLILVGFVANDATLNAAAMALLDRVGLAERAAIPAGTLSHGEKRALEIAMALALKPKAILFDEPMAGVGREESGRIIELMQGLKGRYAALLIEHDMEAVFALADRISVLVQGRIIASGAPDAIRASAEVKAAYLGDEVA